MVKINISKKSHPKIPIMPHVRFWWIDEKKHQHDVIIEVANKLHCNCLYIIVIELHELHMYKVLHTMNYIRCNSCDLFDNIHTCRNTLSWDELQMVIAIQKPNCKTRCKSPHFFIMPPKFGREFMWILWK